MKQVTTLIAIVASSIISVSSNAASHTSAPVYGNSPITVKGYSGDAHHSNSYKGQIARHLLNNSLKKLAGKGNGKSNPELKAKMLAYYSGKEEGRAIIDPQTKDDFIIKQTMIDEISKGKNLKGKTYKGAISGWPGQMTASEIVEFMIDKAASTDGGFDRLTGYDYPQLISKFLMGAVFYNQVVDKYLDDLLSADQKPNNQPYKEGAAYTGKEHVWDEAFGYFGAPENVISLSPSDAKNIGKKADIKIADANGDGMVDLSKEMIYSHASYAADADKNGTSYLHDISKAFIDGRQLITSANGEALTDTQRAQLVGYADVIKTKWQQVIAEAAFKYAGETYEDLKTLQALVDTNGDAYVAFARYGKHWSEMKGFMMALETSGRSLGEVGVKLNRLIGFGPVLLGGNQVSGISNDGAIQTGGDISIGDYMVHLIKAQALLANAFSLKAKKYDVTNELAGLMESLGESKAAESD